MPVLATAKTKVFIGGVLTAPFGTSMTEASFGDIETWTEIKPLETIGNYGDSAEVIKTTYVSDARTRKLKGARDAGTIELVAGLDYTDAGQLAAIAAEADSSTYAFKVEFSDAPAGGTPSQRMFTGLVTSVQEQLGGSGDTMKLAITVEVDSNIV